MLINKINNFLKQYENRNSEQSSFGNIQVISVIRGSIYSNGSFQTDQIIIDNKTISNGIDDTNILGDVTTFNRNNEHSDIEEESSHNMSKEHSEDNLHKDYMNIKPDLTRNVSFVQYEKKKYNDMNASFINVNKENKSSQKNYQGNNLNRSTLIPPVVKPQEILSKNEIFKLINIYEKGDKKKRSLKKEKGSSIPLVPKLLNLNQIHNDNNKVQEMVDAVNALDTPRDAVEIPENTNLNPNPNHNDFNNYEDSLNLSAVQENKNSQIVSNVQKEKNEKDSNLDEDLECRGRGKIFSFYNKKNLKSISSEKRSLKNEGENINERYKNKNLIHVANPISFEIKSPHAKEMKSSVDITWLQKKNKKIDLDNFLQLTMKSPGGDERNDPTLYHLTNFSPNFCGNKKFEGFKVDIGKSSQLPDTNTKAFLLKSKFRHKSDIKSNATEELDKSSKRNEDEASLTSSEHYRHSGGNFTNFTVSEYVTFNSHSVDKTQKSHSPNITTPKKIETYSSRYVKTISAHSNRGSIITQEAKDNTESEEKSYKDILKAKMKAKTTQNFYPKQNPKAKAIPSREYAIQNNEGLSHNDEEDYDVNLMNKIFSDHHHQFVVLQKQLRYNKYNLDLHRKSKVSDPKEILYNNVADYQTLNQLNNSVKKAYDNQMVKLKESMNSLGKFTKKEEMKPTPSKRKEKSPKKDDEMTSYAKNVTSKLKLNNSSPTKKSANKGNNLHKVKVQVHSLSKEKIKETPKKIVKDRDRVIQTSLEKKDGSFKSDTQSKSGRNQLNILELVDEIKSRSDKIEAYFRKKEESLCNSIKELQEKLLHANEKEKVYLEEIDGLRYKLSLLIEKDNSNLNMTSKSTKSAEEKTNEDEQKLRSKLQINLTPLTDLGKIEPEEKFNVKYEIEKYKSFVILLKEMGLESYTLYDEYKENEFIDDICECSNGSHDDFKDHKCHPDKWNHKNLWVQFPKIKIFLEYLGKRLTYEYKSRLKLEEKTVKIITNDLKTIDQLDQKIKRLEQRTLKKVSGTNISSSSIKSSDF